MAKGQYDLDRMNERFGVAIESRIAIQAMKTSLKIDIKNDFNMLISRV